MAMGFNESLNLMVIQAKAATILQPKFEVTNLSFAAPYKLIATSSPTDQKPGLLQLYKTKLEPAPEQQSSYIGNLKNKVVSPHDWKSTADLSLVEDKVFMINIMDMLSEQRDLWSTRLGKIKATNLTIVLNVVMRPIHQ